MKKINVLSVYYTQPIFNIMLIRHCKKFLVLFFISLFIVVVIYVNLI